MELSLKDMNRPALGLVLLANISIYMTALSGRLAVDAWIETLTNIQELVPMLGISILAGIINAQIGHVNKARLVFWRWSHPLPGSRAFTEYARTDPRVNQDALVRCQVPLPTAPEEQNALWYKWYRECHTEASIRQVHREYLFSRDYTGFSFILLLGLSPVAFWQVPSIGVAITYAAVLLLQYLVIRRAARNHGERFITSVLACKTAAA